MFGLFRKAASFSIKESLQDNFLSLCSLPFHKTRSHATRELIKNLSDKKLNIALTATSPTLNSLYALQKENHLQDKKVRSDVIDLINFEVNEKISARQEERRQELVKSIQEEQRNIIATQVAPALLKDNQDYPTIIKKVLHDIAILAIAEKAIVNWENDRWNHSERASLVSEFKENICSTKQYYEELYKFLHAKHMQSLETKAQLLQRNAAVIPRPKAYPIKGLEGAFFFKQPSMDPFVLAKRNNKTSFARLQGLNQIKGEFTKLHDDYFFGTIQSRNRTFEKVLNNQEKQKYATILNVTPAPKRHWWNRLSFAIFTPFLNLLIDTDSFNFFVDGFNIFGDLVRSF